MEEPVAIGDTFRAYVLDNDWGTAPDLDVYMDSELWKDLPDDVLEKVMLVLPARSQAKFRAVSKTWLSRFKCAEFQKKSAALAFSLGRHMCGIVHKKFGEPWKENEDVVGASSRYKVHKLSLAFLPKEFQDIRKLHIMNLNPLCLIQWGLIALETQFPEDYKLCLVNPVNQTWKVLQHPECPPGSSVQAISLVAAGGGSGYSYKALVHCADPDLSECGVTMRRGWYWYSNRTFMVYCSSTDAWTPTALASTSPEQDFSLRVVLLLEGPLVYARLLENRTTTLEDLQTDYRSHGLRVPLDGHYGEGFFMVTSVDRAPGHGERFEILKLNETSKEWERISVLPDDIKARMVPPEASAKQSIILVSAQVVETVIFLKAVISGHAYVPRAADAVGLCNVPVHHLAFHIAQGSWHLVLTEGGARRLPHVSHRFFKPNPSIHLPTKEQTNDFNL